MFYKYLTQVGSLQLFIPLCANQYYLFLYASRGKEPSSPGHPPPDTPLSELLVVLPHSLNTYNVVAARIK